MLTIRLVRVCVCVAILLALVSAAVFCQGNGAGATISVADPLDATGKTRYELPMVTPQEADRLRLLQQYFETRARILEEIATAMQLNADLERLKSKKDEELTDAEKALLANGLDARQQWIVNSLPNAEYERRTAAEVLADSAQWLTRQWLMSNTANPPPNTWTQAMWDSNKDLVAGGSCGFDGHIVYHEIVDPNASDDLKEVSYGATDVHERTHYDYRSRLAKWLNGEGWFDSYATEHTQRKLGIKELEERIKALEDDLEDPINADREKQEEIKRQIQGLQEETQNLQREIDQWLREKDGQGRTNQEKLDNYDQWVEDNYSYALHALDEAAAYSHGAEFLKRYLAQLDAARAAQAAQAAQPAEDDAQSPSSGPTSAPIGGNQPHRAEGPPAAQEHAAVAGIPEDIREAAEELGRATGLEAPGEGWTWPPPWCPGTSVQAVICDAQTWADSSDPKATPALKAKARSLVAYLRTASNENAQEVARLYIQAFHRGYQEAS